MSESPRAPVRDAEAGKLTLAAAQERLSSKSGRPYWRALEELSQSEDFMAAVENEFPDVVTTLDPVDRREFLRLMGASLAMAGLTACTRQPTEKIVPYVQSPEEIIPGKPLFFATAMSLGGYAMGLLAESHMGRPTKLEGNPEHPSSLGATDAFAQAAILSLYDPDRSRAIFNRGRASTWESFVAELDVVLTRQKASQGAGLRILTETVTSPTLANQIRSLRKEYPNAKWHQYEPVNRQNVYEGALLAFEKPVDTHFRLDEADVILSLDADFLAWGPARVRYARDFAARRDLVHGHGEMNRLYVVQSSPSITGASADHTLPLKPSEVEAFARAVAKALGIDVAQSKTAVPTSWVDAVVQDLKKSAGRSVVIAGDHQPPFVHALAHAMNAALGNHGKTVRYSDPVEAEPMNQSASLADLTDAMKAGNVSVLLMLGGNPAYNTPADLGFAEAMRSVRLNVRLGAYEDETSALSHWHIPEAHFLEAWSDTRAFDGTVTVVQPLIEPLYDGKSAHEVLAALLGQPAKAGYEIVREYWQEQKGDEGFEASWRKVIHDGFISGSEATSRRPSIKDGFLSVEPAVYEEELELVFVPDTSAWDGRFVNNGWLQELPRPLTKLVWDNVAMVSPATAKAQGLQNGDVVVVGSGELTLQAPIWITPGHADGAVSIQLGYGQQRAGRIGRDVGYNAYRIRRNASPWLASAFLYKTGQKHKLVSTQANQTMAGRDHVRTATFEAYREDHHLFEHAEHTSIYPAFDYEKGPQWGMVINLSQCVGCNACLTACQSENNVPIVGKDQVDRGREMHWIRLDRYYQGGEENPDVYMQPLPCMHCENAPCEAVCPVAATVHSRDGINQMIYNRCVGTRYCSNNCPYKVRRFNFYKFTDDKTPSLKLMRNPDVTVRARGVMEKCTYCVQRISEARIEAKKAGREIADGEVITACQQVCPTKAITFGNINDPASEVTKHRGSPLNYSVLAELVTQPRTTYLARVRNPNPELEEASKA